MVQGDMPRHSAKVNSGAAWECGILAHRLICARFTNCGRDYLVASSCKGEYGWRAPASARGVLGIGPPEEEAMVPTRLHTAVRCAFPNYMWGRAEQQLAGTTAVRCLPNRCRKIFETVLQQLCPVMCMRRGSMPARARHRHGMVSRPTMAPFFLRELPSPAI